MDNKIKNLIYINYINVFLYVVSYSITTILPLIDLYAFEGIVLAMNILLAWAIWFTSILLIANAIGLAYAIKNEEDDNVKSALVICLLIQPIFTFFFAFQI